jgi:hypothetical protein
MQNAILPSMSLAALVLACGLCVGVGGSPAHAQDAAAAEEQTPSEKLRDFVHFVRIANYDVAGALGQELLDSGMEPEAFVDLVESTGEGERLTRALTEAVRVPELEAVASGLDRLFRDGKLKRARHPDEVARNIALLNEGLRARSLGRERLLAAGEYAVPQLLEAFLQNNDLALKAQVQRVLIDMGRQAITPLATALPALDAARQEAVAEVLGLIPYRTSLPYLADLAQTTNVPAVRQAASAAMQRLGGTGGEGVAGLYATLAEGYYDERAELTSFPDEAEQLVWNYDAGLGLVFVPVATDVAHEAMAMRLAERSLTLSPEQPETAALWVASNLSRDIDTPEGYDNPVYADARRPADYYAIAAGSDISQRVLGRAIADRDTPLALRAIGAIQETAGPRAMLAARFAGSTPLIDALNYRNRRVQYEAALAIGGAQPREVFGGSERVVPLLAGVVRDVSQRFALVLTGSDTESYERVRTVLEGEGYTVLPSGTLDALRASIAEAPGIDLVVTGLALEPTLATLAQIRSEAALSVAPVVALVPGSEVEAVRREHRQDQTIAVRRSSIEDAEFAAAASQVVLVTSGGPIDQAEAAIYTERALSTLRDLAVQANPVLRVEDASDSLLTAVESAEGTVLAGITDVLSYVSQPRAQETLTTLALQAKDTDTQLMLLDRVAVSGRRNGNLLSDRLVRELVSLARSEDNVVATSAAAALGSLGVEASGLVPLILNDAGAAASSVVGN